MFYKTSKIKIIKGILAALLVFFSGLFLSNIVAAAEEGKAKAACKTKAGENMLHCENFRINISNNDFNPGGGALHSEIRSGEDAATGGPSTTNTVNVTLGLIIKNMIIVFGVFALFVMTIGGGYMIFHAGEESLLTRGKLMLKYGIISLALALASGVMVNVVNWLLYK